MRPSPDVGGLIGEVTRDPILLLILVPVVLFGLLILVGTIRDDERGAKPWMAAVILAIILMVAGLDR